MTRKYTQFQVGEASELFLPSLVVMNLVHDPFAIPYLGATIMFRSILTMIKLYISYISLFLLQSKDSATN